MSLRYKNNTSFFKHVSLNFHSSRPLPTPSHTKIANYWYGYILKFKITREDTVCVKDHKPKKLKQWYFFRIKVNKFNSWAHMLNGRNVGCIEYVGSITCTYFSVFNFLYVQCIVIIRKPLSRSYYLKKVYEFIYYNYIHIYFAQLSW